MKLARNVFGILDRTASSRLADRPGYGFEGEVHTFREMRDAALSVAGGLYAQGVRPGDKVAVMMGNRMEWLESYFGLAALGAICVPVNVLLTGPEIAHVCRDSGSRTLIVDEIALRGLEGLDHDFDLVVTLDGIRSPATERQVTWPQVREGHALPDDHVGPDLDDTFLLYYSSGTTGLPKAAEHTHNSILWNAIGQWQGLSLQPHHRNFVISSLSWAAGLHNFVMGLTWNGGYSQFRRTGGAAMDNITASIEEYKITHVMLVPSLLRELVTRPDLMARLSESTLELILTGAEPVPVKVIETVCRGISGVNVCQGYGLSEFPSITAMLMADEVFDHEGSTGRALPHTDLAVRDEDGQIRRHGTGELLIRSLATMKGYHNRPEETAKVMRDGWLHSGDLVELDEEGFVTIIGRTKDVIISGALNIYPKEVEDVIHRIPGVVECAVVGVPHERFGETAVAVVVTDDPEFDAEQVTLACAAQLASYKRPRQVIVRPEPLPRSANSKLLKRELRPWVAVTLEGTD